MKLIPVLLALEMEIYGLCYLSTLVNKSSFVDATAISLILALFVTVAFMVSVAVDMARGKSK